MCRSTRDHCSQKIAKYSPHLSELGATMATLSYRAAVQHSQSTPWGGNMYGLKHAVILALTLPLLAVPMLAQQKSTQPAASAAATKDVDPLALDVLRAVAEPVEKAQFLYL